MIFPFQILRSHVMVRVGGGWDTLAHYLDKHDPCRCRSGKLFQNLFFLEKKIKNPLNLTHNIRCILEFDKKDCIKI